jgi:hypothetical protein
MKVRSNLMLACVLSMGAGISLAQHSAEPPSAPKTDAPQPIAKKELTPVPVEAKPAPATPIDAKKAELGHNVWNPDWDKMIEELIPAEMLSSSVPRDVRRFCPNFYNMKETDKRVFWAYFFQALAGAEAGLEPTTNVRHPQMAKVDKVTKQPVHSEGLLQLTFEDQQLYGCNFDWQHDRQLGAHDPDRTILQPKNNLACGIKILDNQIINLRKPLLTRSSYWSPLQPRTVANRHFLTQMVNPPAACAKPQRPQHLKDVTTADVHQQAQQAKAE